MPFLPTMHAIPVCPHQLRATRRPQRPAKNSFFLIATSPAITPSPAHCHGWTLRRRHRIAGIENEETRCCDHSEG
jgi:hypothetical protein